MYNEGIMAFLKGAGDFFALDIGTNAVRVVQLSGGGQSWNLSHYGYAPVDAKTTASDSPEAKHKLGEIIMTAIGQSGISARDVVVGLPSTKTFTTVIDMPAMSESELKSTIKYQLDQYIPMPLDDAKIDWSLLGASLREPNQQEVLLTSTANSYAESRLEFVEGLGFNVIALEPDPIAMIRSLLPAGVTDARLIIDMGEQSTDIAITYGDAPRLVRTIPMGLNSLVKAAVQNLNVKDDQARQFILKFGLAPDRLEGQVYRAVEGTLENFVSELIKSIKFFQTRYPSIAVGGILLSGFTLTIPRLIEYIGAKTQIQTAAANPWQKVRVNQGVQQQLLPIANEFATVVGLAQRVGKI
jgi:type IV pilus assembly protein PilM